jgi:hypothetical protein
MRILLRLKHWQLFLLTWGLPILIDIFAFSDPGLLLQLFPVMMIVFTVGIFGWVWAISTELQSKLPPNVKLNVRQFKILFLIPIVYILGITIWMAYSFYGGQPEAGESMGAVIGLIVVLHLFSMVCIFLGLRFAAKTLKSIELGRMAKFGDYAGEFFLIWFSPIGVWILQPRLNKLTDDQRSNNYLTS